MLPNRLALHVAVPNGQALDVLRRSHAMHFSKGEFYESDRFAILSGMYDDEQVFAASVDNLIFCTSADLLNELQSINEVSPAVLVTTLHTELAFSLVASALTSDRNPLVGIVLKSGLSPSYVAFDIQESAIRHSTAKTLAHLLGSPALSDFRVVTLVFSSGGVGRQIDSLTFDYDGRVSVDLWDEPDVERLQDIIHDYLVLTDEYRLKFIALTRELSNKLPQSLMRIYRAETWSSALRSHAGPSEDVDVAP